MNKEEYEKHILTLGPVKKGDVSVQISRADGQIVGISKGGVQFMHGGGLPDLLKTEEDKKGWQNSEIVMFPIVSRAKDYQVWIKEKSYPMDQHGISRILGFEKTGTQSDLASLIQRHDGRTLLPNPKYEQDESRPEKLHWPFAYDIYKVILLKPDRATIIFYLSGPNNKNMPYMFGWHPAFKMFGPPSEGVFFNLTNQTHRHQIDLEEVIDAPKTGALKIKGMREIHYINGAGGRGISVYHKCGFKNMMLWCPGEDSGMFCIEPVTHIPLPPEKQIKPHFTDNDTHDVLKRKEVKEFSVEIIPYTFKPYKKSF